MEIKNAYSQLNKIPGANKAAKSLSKARRAIDGKKRDFDKALKHIDATLAAIEVEVEWRKKIKSGPYKDLVSFEKYTHLAKEAMSAGDKTLSENYLQHADHFMRVIEDKNRNRNDNRDNIVEKPAEEKKNLSEENSTKQVEEIKDKT